MNPHNAQSDHFGHHHNHSHNHGHGHQHHPGCAHHRQNTVAPQQYFEKIEQLKRNGEFELYWMEIIKGVFFQKKMQAIGFNFFASLNAQVLTSIVGMFHMMLNFEWLPNRVRPFISGMFLPLIFLIILNSNVLGIELNLTLHSIILLMPLFLYMLTSLRGTGNIVNEQNQRKAIKAFELRPYLENGPLKCSQCKIPKIFRSMHCPVCKVCNPKFTRHSLVFGTCIGAANQLLALLFFLSLFVFGTFSIYSFWFTNSYGLITKIMIYVINIYVGWNGLHQFLTITILNIYYGITQFEAQSWIMLQYLMKFPERKFFNNINQGFIHNFKESCYALLGLSGFESQEDYSNKDLDEHPLKQQINEEDELSFPDLVANKKYVVNWAKAFFYLVPQIPNHPSRDDIIKIMKNDEPRMIENFRLMKKFKTEVTKQFPELNQFQIQQRAMMKMHEHIAKNGPPAHMQMKVPPQQQKVIQLQMIGHLKQQFVDDKQMFVSFENLENKLKNEQMSPEEASLNLRELQQKILQKKMNQVLKQQEAMKIQQNDQSDKNSQSKFNSNLKNITQDPEQQPKHKSKTNLPKINGQPLPINPQQNSMQMDSRPLPMQMNPQQHPMQMMIPSPEQQKAMMIMSFGNIKGQFSDHKEIIDEVERLQGGLKDNSISLDEAKISMMKIQPQLMQIKMAKMAKGGQGQQQPSHPMMPSPQQQKSMLLVGIQNMKQKFPEDQYILQNLDKIKKGLTQKGMDMYEARIKMSQIQSHIMKKVIEQKKPDDEGKKKEQEQNSSNEGLEPQKRDE